MRRKRESLAAITALFALLGCGAQETSVAPLPVALSDDAVGYYCGMTLAEHEGPKAQIIVEGRDEPYWFAQVRDGVYFLRSPEETAVVRAFYVTDYADVELHQPVRNTQWIAAAEAFFVIDSRMKGGMGAPETVPFSTAESATLYVADHGGRIVRLNEIPDDYILAPYAPEADEMGGRAHDAHG